MRRRVEPPASTSAPRAVAAALSFHAYLRVHMCTCCVVSVKLHQTGALYASAGKYIHGDRCDWHYSMYVWPYSPQGVHMHSCMRILFIYNVQSLHYMRVYYTCFLTPACVGGRGLEVGPFSACLWLVLVPGVGGYVLAGAEIGNLSWIFLYFACIRAYTHTNYLGSWYEPRCGTDTWRTGRIQIDQSAV